MGSTKKGWIVGEAWGAPDGYAHAVMWDPPYPEPATLSILALGGVAILAWGGPKVRGWMEARNDMATPWNPFDRPQLTADRLMHERALEQRESQNNPYERKTGVAGRPQSQRRPNDHESVPKS